MRDPHGETAVSPESTPPQPATSAATPLEIDLSGCETIIIEGAGGRAPQPAPRGYVRWKPAVEAAVALVVLIVSAPLIALAALLVKLTSRGPVFYTQARVGKDGRLFTIYKLRTMYLDSESRTGAVWSAAGDTRVTPIGRVLRATHLDEFPQAVNVLLGQMSLIGPRPERPQIVQMLQRHVDGYAGRLRARPGITGLAQVHLPPDVDLEGVRKKLVYDLYYIDHLGAWLDFRIFVCTLLFLVGCPLRLSRRVLRLPDPLPHAGGCPAPAAPFAPPHNGALHRVPADGPANG
jgi:lipopolysaccharide/colanic/teichoic acid biosynthesis glycosyltransferase